MLKSMEEFFVSETKKDIAEIQKEFKFTVSQQAE